MNKERAVEYYSCNRADEHLKARSPNEAIEEYLDGREDLGGHIMLYHYARKMKPTPEKLKGLVLELVIEQLDLSYDLGPPDEPTEQTEEMESAEAIFLRAFLESYVPWACEIVDQTEIDVQAWVRDNRPDWLGLVSADAINP